MRLKALGSALLLGWTVAAVAQEAKPTPPAEAPAAPTMPPAAPAAPAPAATAPQFKFELHGFTSMSGYVQDGNTGPSEGQQAIYATPTAGTTPKRDATFTGFDVRQSRFNFSVSGPKAFGGATPKAVLEIDWFGGYGSGNYGSASLVPRLRLGYGELNWGANRIAFGQQNDLVFGMAPTSLAHIAFPFGYMAGNIGWRRPGIWGFHTFNVGGPKVEFAWEVGRSTWADAAASIGAGTVTSGAGFAPARSGIGLGEASSLPALEARVTVSQGQDYSVWAAAHYNRVDGSGFGNSTSANLDVAAFNAGAKVLVGPVTVAATGFIGKNLAPLVANYLTFQPNTSFNVHERGGWVQAGLNVSKEFSLWAFLGADQPNQDENMKVALANAEIARATARATGTVGTIAGAQPGAPSYQFRNTTFAALAQYRDGGYALGLEWVRFDTRNARFAFSQDATGAAAPTTVTFTRTEAVKTDQVMLSGNYFF